MKNETFEKVIVLAGMDRKEEDLMEKYNGILPKEMELPTDDIEALAEIIVDALSTHFAKINDYVAMEDFFDDYIELYYENDIGIMINLLRSIMYGFELEAVSQILSSVIDNSSEEFDYYLLECICREMQEYI